MAEDPNTLMLFLRLAMSFGIVLGLVGGVTWVLRRKGLLRPTAGSATHGRLEVLDRKSLGKSGSLVLARVGGKAMLLGVTGERIELLSDADGLDAAWRDQGAAASVEEPVLHTTQDASAQPSTGSVVDLATARGRNMAGAAARAQRPMAGGARRTGLPMAAPAAGRTRMSFIEALQELTVRRS